MAVMRSNSEGLEKLLSFIYENGDLLGNEKLFELEDIYSEINDEFFYGKEDFKHDMAYEIGGLLSTEDESTSVANMADDLDDLFVFADISEQASAQETIEHLHGKAKKVFEKYQKDDEDSSLYSKIEEIIFSEGRPASLRDEMLKMIKAGYVFNCDYGKLLKSEIERDRRESEAAEEFRKLGSEFPLPYAKVREIDFVTYGVQNYEVDAIYDLRNEKVTGKGSRKLKDEIIQTINMYLEFKRKHSA